MAHVPLEQRSTLRLFLGFVGTMIVPVAAVSVGAVILAASDAGSYSRLGQPETTEPPHLKPIPVSKDGCPYVIAMHNAADAFQSQTPVFEPAPGSRGQVYRLRPAVIHAADVLDATVAAGIPHVPPPIRPYLMTVRDDLQQERELAVSTHDQGASVLEVALQNGASVQPAFGFAGDLVGHACSVGLGPDNGAAPATHP